MADITDFIQQVKQANDIVDVIGSRLELKRHGASFFARCPFHGEKTASFNVNRNLQIFKCFGCGESGDVIGFVQKYESCTFMEALEILAKRANLKMPEFSSVKRDKNYEEKKKKKDLYMDILRDTAKFYFKQFRAPAGEVARKYMESRCFDDDTLRKFGIGYSPDAYSLPKYLASLKYSVEDCLTCGVVQRRSKDNTVIDALCGRLIVPIFNMQGKVIAFGGRGLDERTISFGKYKNTQETPIFVKNANLFNLNVCKEQKQQTALPNVVMVEGYMDVIAMYQAGFKRCVASMGTSLTENQAKLLSRLTDTVYICYDGDSAGQKATVRGLDILDKAGLEVKVMSVPEKLDPDEYIKKYGSSEFEKLIDKALPLPDYKLKLLDDAFDINSTNASVRNDAIAKYVKGAVIMLQQLDEYRRPQYVTAVSLKTGYSEDYIRRKLETKPSEQTQEQTPAELSAESKAKYFVLACELACQDYARLDFVPLCDNAFLDKLFNYVVTGKANGVKLCTDMMYTVCPEADNNDYNRVLEVDFSTENYDKNKQYYNECVKTIKTELLKDKRNKIMLQLKTAEPSQMQQLYEQIESINNEINSL